MNTFLQLPEYVKQFSEISCTFTLKNLSIRFLKPIIWHVFQFKFYAFHLTTLNLIVSKINLQWSRLLAFPYFSKSMLKLHLRKKNFEDSF